VYHERIGKYGYTSKWGNEYSIILTGAAFLHKYYFYLFQNLPRSSRAQVDTFANCEDILVNFMVSHVTGLPPIKTTQKKQYMTRIEGDEAEPLRGRLSSHWDNSSHFQERQKCLSLFISDFGYVALRNSQLRLDPLLFKDNVARFRKKYPNIDSVEP
jgi:glucuronyl/N-acetylglucosaminyl transferase EXT1